MRIIRFFAFCASVHSIHVVNNFSQSAELTGTVL